VIVIPDEEGEEAESSDEDAEDVAEAEDEIELGEVEVEGEKPGGEGLKNEPTMIEVIGREEIEESGAEDLLDLLRRKVGMNESETFGGTSIGLLGMPAKFTLVLIDGRRITGRVFEQIDFNQLPLSAVERIEVIKGPSSTLYGSDAIGGVINIITRKPDEGLTVELRSGIGKFGLETEGVGAMFGRGRNSLLLDCERFLYGGYDFDPRTLDTDGDEERHYNIFGKWRLKFAPAARLEFTAFRFNEIRQSVKFAPPDITRRGDTKTRRLQLSLGLEWDVKPGQTASLGIRDGSFAHSYSSVLVGYEDTFHITAFTEDSRDFELEYMWYLTDHIVTAGLQRLHDEIESDRVADNGAEYDTNVAFVQHEWKISPTWTWIWGARADDNSEYGARVSPRIGFRWRPNDGIDVRCGISRGFRSPGLRELYFDFNSPFGYRVEGNPDLSPETSTGYQLSFDARPTKNDQVRVTLFRNEVANLIEAVEISESPWVFRTQNIENALTQGVELGWGRKFDENWRMSVNALFTDATDNDTGNRLPNSPQWDYRGALNYSRSDFNAEAFLRHTAKRFTDLENETEAPAFTTFDLHFGYNPDDWEFKVHLLNVLDKVDRRYGPKPGFEWQIEIVRHF